MLIAIRCDAGKDQTGRERKVSILVDSMGQLQEVRLGWPKTDEAGIHWGPLLRITPEEYLVQLKIAQEVGL